EGGGDIQVLDILLRHFAMVKNLTHNKPVFVVGAKIGIFFKGEQKNCRFKRSPPFYSFYGIKQPKNTNFMVLQPYFFNNNFAVENNESKGFENNA
ncbi:MAG: hypothetical protein II165_01405, partial [Bacteroidales bacterium]|nr:hypothetical protein [Bacteroidales bacterium]